MWKWRDPALAHALVAMLDETRNSDLFLTWDKWSLVNTLSSFQIQDSGDFGRQAWMPFQES